MSQPTQGGLVARWFGTSALDHRDVLKLLVPVVISTAFSTAFFALSPLLVAPAGVEAISAVSSVEFLNLFLLNVFIALATAGSVLVAQHRGRGDDGGVVRAASGTLWATLLPAVVLGLVLLAVHGPVLHALLGPAGAGVVEQGRIYLIGSVLSYPAVALAESCAAVLRGIARTAPALYLTVTTNGGFLVLAAILVRGLGMGVPGLAIAIVVARYAGAGLAVWLLRRDSVLGRTPIRRPDRALVWRVCLIGVPFVAEQLFFNGGKLIIQFFIVSMGTAQITANAIALSLAGISEVLAQAMCVAIVPIVGQAIGRGRHDEARRIIQVFLLSSTLVTMAAGLVMLTRFGWLLALFHTPPQVAGEVTAVFVLVLAARFVWGWSFLLPAGLRAAGDTVFTTAVAASAMLVRVVFIWFVGVHLGYGVVGVWAVMVGEWALRSVAFLARLRGTHWQRRSFVTAELAA